MKRALFVTSFPPPMTGQNVMSEQVARWAADVAEVVRIDTSDPDELIRSGGAAGRVRRALGHWQRLRRALRTRPDVVYLVLSSSTLGRLRDAVTVSLARRWTQRIVGHVQVGDFGPSLSRLGLRAISRALLRQMDAVIVLSGRLAPAIQAVAPPGTVQVVPNTAPDVVPTLDQVAESRRQRREAGDLRVLMVANALPGKGHDRVLAGLAAYQAGGPLRPARLDLVGSWTAPARRRFEQDAERLGLAERVTLYGAVSDRARLADLLLGADVVALPSRYRHEALPVSLIEALAAGRPVVGSDHAAIPDVVTDQTGILLADDQPAALAAALRHLADPAVWDARSRGARAHFDERFAPSVVRAATLRALSLP